MIVSMSRKCGKRDADSRAPRFLIVLEMMAQLVPPEARRSPPSYRLLCPRALLHKSADGLGSFFPWTDLPHGFSVGRFERGEAVQDRDTLL